MARWSLYSQKLEDEAGGEFLVFSECLFRPTNGTGQIDDEREKEAMKKLDAAVDAAVKEERRKRDEAVEAERRKRDEAERKRIEAEHRLKNLEEQLKRLQAIPQVSCN